MIKIKKILSVFAITVFSLTLTGCWNYRGVDEFESVMGVAVDKSESGNGYSLTFECVDFKSAGEKSGEITSKLIRSEGSTIFDAVRKAKTSLGNRLYFSQMQSVIVSQELAREVGIESLVEWLVRAQEVRETTLVIISREKSARALFNADPISAKFISLEISDIVEEDNKTSSFTVKSPLYQTYTTLESEGVQVCLPAFGVTDNAGDKKKIISMGSAVFNHDKFVGFISPYETQSMLFVDDKVKGGIIPVDLNQDGKDDVSLEISGSKTKKTWSYDGKQVRLEIKIKTNVYSTELPIHYDIFDTENVKKLQDMAADKLKDQIRTDFAAIQKNYDQDIFGIGNMIFKSNHTLWHKIKKDWPELFRNLDVQVTSEFIIKNSGMDK